MKNQHLILGNGASPKADRPDKWADASKLGLATFGKQQNVTLKIGDLTDRTLSDLPPMFVDLMEIAAIVYAADQACRRSGPVSIDYGDTWNRRFRFEILVREPRVWNRASVREALTRSLSFLSGDSFEFAFSLMSKPPSNSSYVELGTSGPGTSQVEHVALFSGGLDSLTGAAENLLVHKRNVALVSHRPVETIAQKQRELVDSLTKMMKPRRARPLHVRVRANKSARLGIDHTQRCRSFLYASMAAAVAHAFRLDSISFYENGIVSVNLPLCGQELGTRATRTTHPRVLSDLSVLFTELLGRTFTVKNEYIHLTKQDVLDQLKNMGCSKLARSSQSCTHTRQLTRSSPHCGQCSQCISRRFAALGAEYGDDDPAAGYRADVLLAARKKAENRVLAERFIGFARRVEEMESPEDFHTAYSGELSRVLPYLDEGSELGVSQMFDLHKRHALQVGGVLTKHMQIHADDRRRGQIARTSILDMAFDPHGLPCSHASGQPSDGAAEAVTHAADRPPRCEIGAVGSPCFIEGKTMGVLTESQHAVLSALAEAGKEGLKKEELESVRSGARTILRRLRNKDPEWAKVIQMAGSSHTRYRLRT